MKHLEFDPIRIVITGHPVAKGRWRAYKRKDGNIGAFTPQKTRKWEDDARIMATLEMGSRPLLTGCIELHVDVWLVVPASWPSWKRNAALGGLILPTGRPDLDNFVKAAKDAMNGIVWVDDSQVVTTEARKCYSERPSVGITVVPLKIHSSRTVKRADIAEPPKKPEEKTNGNSKQNRL